MHRGQTVGLSCCLPTDLKRSTDVSCHENLREQKRHYLGRPNAKHCAHRSLLRIGLFPRMHSVIKGSSWHLKREMCSRGKARLTSSSKETYLNPTSTPRSTSSPRQQTTIMNTKVTLDDGCGILMRNYSCSTVQSFELHTYCPPPNIYPSMVRVYVIVDGSCTKVLHEALISYSSFISRFRIR